jgi:hypothetical protein
LLLPKVVLKADGKIVSRRGIDVAGFARTASAQEAQQLAHLVPLTPPRFLTDGLTATPTAALVLLDVNLAELGERRAALREPTIERQGVPCLDMDDTRRVLLLDQRCDKLAEMAC